MRYLTPLLAVALTAPSALLAQGQLHEPTAQEHRVLDPAIAAIENIVVQIKEADDRIRELLTRVDWRGLDAVLTP